MKVWFPTVRAGSGNDVYVQRLVDGLKRRGVEAEISWLPPAAELWPRLLSRPPPAGTSIIHANSWHAAAYAPFGLPLVVSMYHCVHDPAYRDAHTAAQRLYHRLVIRRREARALEQAAAVVTLTEASRHSIAAVFGYADAQVIPVFADTQVFTPPSGKPGQPFRLLFVGNRSRRKGADLIAEVMQRLGADFELGIAAGLRAARDWELPGNVRLLPPVASEREMAQRYREADALLLLSRQEGFSYAALEAMACGRPVIGFDSPAVREVTQGASVLVPQGAVEELAAVARQLARDPAQYAALSARGRERAVETYGEAAVIDRYVALYQRVGSPRG